MQAVSQLHSIIDMVAALEAEDDDELSDARQAIQDDPLSVEVRSGWATSPAEFEPEEFQILLCTGGPAVRIIGTLGQFNEPASAEIEYQDWFKPWKRLWIEDDDQRDALLTYCRQFYFGD